MSSWDNLEKSGSGQGWEYDEVNLSYDAETDPDGNSIVYYETIGSSVSITNAVKH